MLPGATPNPSQITPDIRWPVCTGQPAVLTAVKRPFSAVYALGNESVFSLGGLLFLLLSVFIGFVVSNPYIKLMTLLINTAKDKIGTLRIANIILLAGLPLGSGGLLFNVIPLTQIALGTVGVQIIFVIGSIPFSFSNINIIDSQVKKSDFKEIAGNIQFLIALIEFILTVLLFIAAIIKGQLF